MSARVSWSRVRTARRCSPADPAPLHLRQALRCLQVPEPEADDSPPPSSAAEHMCSPKCTIRSRCHRCGIDGGGRFTVNSNGFFFLWSHFSLFSFDWWRHVVRSLTADGKVTLLPTYRQPVHPADDLAIMMSLSSSFQRDSWGLFVSLAC